MNVIPEKICSYNLYNEAEKLVGITGEVEMPSFEAMTSTISGAGVLGEVESPNQGHFGSIKMSIGFRTVSSEAAKLFEPRGQTITLRADQSSYDVSSSIIGHQKLRVVMRGVPSSYKLGKASAGNATDSEITLELYYIKVEVNGETIVELDKYNFIYVVNGKDWLAEVRENI